MDTRATEGQRRPKLHQHPFCWCAMLCVLACGCDLVKPAHTRQTAEPLAATSEAQSSDQIEAPPLPRGATSATPAGHTPHLMAVPTAIVDPPPAPALNPVPTAQPAKSNQKVLFAGSQAKVQTNHTVTDSAAKPQPPQTTVTYMPREAAAAIVIKGPPRQPEPPSSRIAVALCLGMSVGAVLVVLLFYAKRRFSVPSFPKARREELFLPSEFKLRDSAIEPQAPLGMLAPEKPVCRSKMELLVSVLVGTTNAGRFLVSKLPLERVGMACQTVRQRMSASLPAISEQCSSEQLPSEAADSKSGELSTTAASPAENGVQSKPAENPPSARSAIPASVPLEEPTQDSIALARST